MQTELRHSYLSTFVQTMVSQGGPEVSDYADLDAVIHEVAALRAAGDLGDEELLALVKAFGPAFSAKTMQGFAFQKPHGYAGDFEIIDRIYTQYRSPDPSLKKWDDYWQEHSAAKAVRNRNQYFVKTIKGHLRADETLSVLNLASGPGRDMFSLFSKSDTLPLHIDCIEQDAKAIAKARSVCADYLDHVTFIQQNALKLRLDHRYHVVWSAGLFDYFSDKMFCHVLKRLKPLVHEGDGEIIIGNFSTINPSRPYMELFDWKLQHRSPQRLIHLAESTGFSREQVTVRREGEGVNLFLHIRC